MPLEERVLQPICVTRCIIDDQKNIYNLLPNELECFTNGTLANIIKQLSSLSMHAEDLFASILQDAVNLNTRTRTLQQKLNNLAVRVTQLDSTNEDISLHDIHLKKPYKPQNNTVQEIFSKKTMPKQILEMYHQCSKPPPLYLLNPFRDDGKDSMKFYTNPNFFFELWREAMLRQVEKEKNNKKLVQRQSKLQNGILQEGKKPRQPANSNDRYRKMVSQQEFLIGEELPNKNVIYMSSNNDAHYDQYDSIRQNNQMNVYGTYNGNAAGQQQQQQQQPHYVYHNGIPHPHQHIHQQINGNANYINQMNSITPPPSYQQMQPHALYGQPEQFNSQMQTLSRRTSRPSQPPPEPPQMMNGHQNASHNEYHQTNGYVSHYSQSNIGGHHQMNGHQNVSHNEYHQTNGYHYSQSNLNPHQQQANLNESSNNPELVNVKRPQSLNREVLGLPPPVPNMNGNGNDSSTNGNHLNNLPPPPPMPVNLNGRLVSSATLQQQHSTSSSTSNQSTASSQPPPPPPPPMPSSIPPPPSAAAASTDVTDNAKSSSNNSSINSKPLAAKETTFEQEILQKQKQLQPVKHIQRPAPKSDPRNDLLAAIREGIKLKRVEDSKQKEVEKNEHLLDVASILARRVAMELSDSESNDSEGSNDWNDDDESHV